MIIENSMTYLWNSWTQKDRMSNKEEPKIKIKISRKNSFEGSTHLFEGNWKERGSMFCDENM